MEEQTFLFINKIVCCEQVCWFYNWRDLFICAIISDEDRYLTEVNSRLQSLAYTLYIMCYITMHHDS